MYVKAHCLVNNVEEKELGIDPEYITSNILEHITRLTKAIDSADPDL